MPLRRVRPLLVVVLAVLATIGVAAPASAATGTGSVTGRVVDSSGTPVPGFAVRLTTVAEEGPNHHSTVTTDASGDFVFTDVVPDRYALFDEEDAWFESSDDWRDLVVAAGATVHEPTMTVLRAATVTGTVVSSVDRSPIAGQTVSAGGPSATTAADGSFSIAFEPGTVEVRTGQRFWFDTVRTLTLPEGATADLGEIALDPAGIVQTGFFSRSGRAIDPSTLSAVVDGCRVTNLQISTCPGVDLYATVGSLQLRPGLHTVRYEVRSSVTGTVRHVTRTVDVTAGQETPQPRVVFPVLDPRTRAVVEAGTYRRGHQVVVRVREGSFVDGSAPRLPVTIRVSGHVVKPTSLRWRTRTSGSRVLVATLPARWSTHASLKVRVVVHGTAGCAGQTSAVTKLVRAH